MYPWEKDVFDLYDEAMERACKLAWSDDESDEEDEDEQSSSKKHLTTSRTPAIL